MFNCIIDIWNVAIILSVISHNLYYVILSILEVIFCFIGLRRATLRSTGILFQMSIYITHVPKSLNQLFVKEYFFMRKMMRPSKDKRVFRNTAVGSKKINLGVQTYRGGIRL